MRVVLRVPGHRPPLSVKFACLPSLAQAGCPEGACISF